MDKINHYEEAIRKHRDQRGVDRCWLDDEELYNTLPEGYTSPGREVAVELGLCEKFINCRRNPKTEYISPQREIERLKAKLQWCHSHASMGLVRGGSGPAVGFLEDIKKYTEDI